MATEYGKRLKAARKKAGLTQKMLAQRAGVSQSTVSELETIGHGSAFTTQFAEVCEVNASWLSTGDGEMLSYDRPHTDGRIVRLAQERQRDARTTLTHLGDLLSAAPSDRRAMLGTLLDGFAREGGASSYIAALLPLLTPSQPSQPSKQAQT